MKKRKIKTLKITVDNNTEYLYQGGKYAKNSMFCFKEGLLNIDFENLNCDNSDLILLKERIIEWTPNAKVEIISINIDKDYTFISEVT